MRSRAAIGTFVSLAAACTLTTGLDGLTGGGGGGGADAGDAGGTLDAPVEAGASEAAADSPSEGGGGGTWCAQQNAGWRLCSDFDRPGDSVTQGFDLGLAQVPDSPGGTFQVDTTAFVSPPHAAVGHANPFGARSPGGAYLQGTLWPLGAAPATIKCSGQWSPSAVSSTTNDWAHVFVLSVYSDAATANEIFDFNVKLLSDGTVALDEIYEAVSPNQQVRHVIPVSVATGQWYAIEMTLAFAGDSSTYSVSVGGVPAPGGTLAHPLPASSHGTLRIGPAYYEQSTTASSPGWTFRYDDVVCY